MERASGSEAADDLKSYVFSLGIELFGIASVEDYKKFFPSKPQPTNFIKEARSIMVIGLPLEPYTVATVLKPEISAIGSRYAYEEGGYREKEFSAATRRWFLTEEKETIYSELDLFSYRISKRLRKTGFKAFHTSVNKKDDIFWRAPFYHQPAMYLTGLGTWGMNCCILSPEFGPRVYVTTIITDCPLPAGRPREEELCTKCGLCVKHCPSNSIDGKGWKNPYACGGYGCCDVCIAVCPVGELKVPKI